MHAPWGSYTPIFPHVKTLSFRSTRREWSRERKGKRLIGLASASLHCSVRLGVNRVLLSHIFVYYWSSPLSGAIRAAGPLTIVKNFGFFFFSLLNDNGCQSWRPWVTRLREFAEKPAKSVCSPRLFFVGFIMINIILVCVITVIEQAGVCNLDFAAVTQRKERRFILYFPSKHLTSTD